MHASSLMVAFALVNIFYCVAFQVHSVLTDMSFQNGFHVSVVLGENLHK